MAFNALALGLKVPVPPLHIPPPAMVTDPFRITCGALAHTVTSVPAFTVGDCEKTRSTSSLTAAQVPLPVLVRVSVTLPLASSVAEGV